MYPDSPSRYLAPKHLREKFSQVHPSVHQVRCSEQHARCDLSRAGFEGFTDNHGKNRPPVDSISHTAAEARRMSTVSSSILSVLEGNKTTLPIRPRQPMGKVPKYPRSITTYTLTARGLAYCVLL